MNKTFISVFAMTLVVVSGCTITVGGGSDHPGGWNSYPQADPGTMAEIDAAAKLMLESNREQTLNNIAGREHLAPSAQVYLVEVALDKLMLESSRRQVILTLINNPYFVSEAKAAILENMDGFMLESSRQQVLETINNRGYVPSGGQMEVIITPQSSIEPDVQVETTVDVTYSTGL